MARTVVLHIVGEEPVIGEMERERAAVLRRLLPLIAGLAELLLWIRQWHGDIDPTYGMPLSDFYETLLDERARSIGATREGLAAWRPPEPAGGRRRRVAA